MLQKIDTGLGERESQTEVNTTPIILRVLAYYGFIICIGLAGFVFLTLKVPIVSCNLSQAQQKDRTVDFINHYCQTQLYIQDENNPTPKLFHPKEEYP